MDGRDASQAAHERSRRAPSGDRTGNTGTGRVDIDDDAEVIAPVKRPRLGRNIRSWIAQTEKRPRISVRQFRNDLSGSVLIETVQHHTIKLSQSADLTNGLLANFLCGYLALSPGHHRTQDAQGGDGIAGRGLKLQNGLSTGDMHGNVIAQGAGDEPLTEQALDDAGAGGYLQPAPDIVQQISGQKVSGWLSDDLAGDAQERMRVC